VKGSRHQVSQTILDLVSVLTIPAADERHCVNSISLKFQDQTE